ncbi:MAG TPA: EamA family transporter [Jatrophihabitans sp.]|nr:EamA family transporter [Jatrophihabitans sp.]
MALRGRVDLVPPQGLILIGIASVQFGAAFAAKLFDRAGPGGVVLMRLVFSAVVLLALTRPDLRGRSRRELLTAAGFGLVLGGMNWSFYQALQLLPLGAAVTLEFAGPLAVAILGSRRLLDLLWVALAGGGVVLLAFGRSDGSAHSLNPRGVLLALLAGTLWAGYIVLSQRVGSRFAGLQGLALALSVAGIALLPVGLIQGGRALLQPAVFGGGLLVALLSSLIPYSLELIALRRLRAATFGLLMSLEPAFAALAGVLVLGEQLRLRTVTALVMVVAASAGTSLQPGRPAVAPVRGDTPPLG